MERWEVLFEGGVRTKEEWDGLGRTRRPVHFKRALQSARSPSAGPLNSFCHSWWGRAAFEDSFLHGLSVRLVEL